MLDLRKDGTLQGTASNGVLPCVSGVPMNGDCGHAEAHYCVMECGDYVTDMHRADKHGPSGCYASYFACWACVQSGDAGTLSDQWWAKHRQVCPVGYHATH